MKNTVARSIPVFSIILLIQDIKMLAIYQPVTNEMNIKVLVYMNFVFVCRKEKLEHCYNESENYIYT